MLLGSDAGRRVLSSWPQYQGSVVLDNLGRPHVHLDVFRCALFVSDLYLCFHFGGRSPHFHDSPLLLEPDKVAPR